MSGAPNTQSGVSYDADGRVQEQTPGRVGLRGAIAQAREQAQARAGAVAAGEAIDPEWASKNPEKAQARLIEQQRADFNARFRPLEEAAIAEYMKSPEQAAQRAGGIAAEGFANAQGMSQRALGRQGARMTADQMRASGNATGLAQARAIGTAENTMRRSLRDRNTEGLGAMIGIGRGIQGGVNRDMGAAAGMQASRNAAHSAAKSQHKAGAIGGIASGAGMGFAIGGPVGAGIGAVAGGLMSFL